MANTASAKKAIRSSSRKVSVNEVVREKYKETKRIISRTAKEVNAGVAKVSKADLDAKLAVAYKQIDKAAKSGVNVISKNKANRLKSRLAKQVAALSSKA